MSRSAGGSGRKLLHISMGGFALLLAFLSWWQALVLAVAACAHNRWILPLYASESVFRREGTARGADAGILLYPLSIAILIVPFHSHLEIVAAAWGLLAFGDGFATIAGRAIGGPRLWWNREKTWSGLLTFTIMGFMAARFLYAWTVFGQVLPSAGDRTAQGLAPHLPWMLQPPAPGAHSGPYPGLGASTLMQILSAAMGGGWGMEMCAVIGAATLLAAILESLPLGIDDNLLVPLASAGFLFALTLFDPSAWAAHRPSVLASLPWALGVNAALGLLAYAARSVSRSGAAGGILVGVAVWALGGWRAFAILVVFFLLGTASTKTGYAKKAALGIAQEQGGRRGAKHAAANCAAAVLLAYVSATTAYGGLALLGLVAALATAASDTVASEIGQVFGRRAYLVNNFRAVPPGTDGAVSVQGTLAGIAAATSVAAVALGLGLLTPAGVLLVVLAAFFGSTLESYIAAIWTGSRVIDNELINFANTVAGALFAIAGAALLPGLSLFPMGGA